MLGFGRHWYRDFLSDLRSLIASGVPVQEALESLGKPTASAVVSRLESRRRLLATRLAAGLREGRTLAEAMAEDSGIPAAHVALVDAGERSGALEQMLARALEDHDQIAELRQAFVMRVGMNLLTLLAAVVLLPLPLLVSHGVGRYLLVEVVLWAPVVLSAFLVFRFVSAPPTSEFRRRGESLIERIPLLGPTVAAFVYSRCFYVVGRLLEAGLPYGDALLAAQRVSLWSSIRVEFREASGKIENAAGETAAEAFAPMALFRTAPEQLTRLETGEKAGSMDAACLELGKHLTDTATRRLTVAVSCSSVLFVVVMGIVVLIYGLSVLNKLYSPVI